MKEDDLFFPKVAILITSEPNLIVVLWGRPYAKSLCR